MKIILTQDVKNLGHKDDVVTVKDGYARNFLIPTGKAKLASEGAMKMLAEDMRQRAFKMDKLRKDAEALAVEWFYHQFGCKSRCIWQNLRICNQFASCQCVERQRFRC